MQGHKDWKGNTGGKPWMQRMLVFWLRHTPLLIPYFCMAWMVPFYMAVNRRGFLSIYHYFRQCHYYSSMKSFWKVYLNHFRFGQIIIDRFAMYAGKAFNIEIEGQDYFDELDNKDEGFVIVSSHIGNYELAGYSLLPKRKTFNALIFGGETRQVMEGRNAMFGNKKFSMIPVSEDLSHIFRINAALSEGNIISIPGDRIFGSSKFIRVTLFGNEACFPLGPFATAVQRDVKMQAIFVMKTSVSNYKVIVKPIEIDDRRSRNERPKYLAQAFAKHLENVLRQYPEQWFNFYNFYNNE